MHGVLPLATTLGAALVFLVQPIIAAAILPWFGGAPAVWTTSLMFFQTALLAGYAWAWWLERRLGGRGVFVHLGLVALSLVLLPITPDAAWRPADPSLPVLHILGLLAVTVGLPYALLAATAPLVQARAAAQSRARPYRLYAWSNLGSLVAIVLHPLVVAPLWGARAQTHLWSVAYGVYALVLAAALWPTRHADAAPAATGGPAPAPGDRGRWLAFSAAGSALLVTVSQAISEDLSVTPLFWVVPLGLYLLTFILVFADPRWTPRRVFGPLFLLALVGLAVLQNVGYRAPWWAQLSGYCGALFLGCLLLHGELVRARPGPAHLTGFYLWMSAGGALGGGLAGVVGPWLLPLPVELPLTLLFAFGVFAHTWYRGLPRTAPREGPRLLTVGFAVALAIWLALPVWHRLRGGAELRRTFFGALHIRDFVPKKRSAAIRHLLDGRISHGFQWLDPERRREPTAYFVPDSGIGRALGRPGGPRRVGVIGLGVGTLAAYGRPGDVMRFYEINPAVVDVARERFTFLSDSPATIDVALGDGRLSLEREADQGFAVLAVDAFSGDAIPTHLITAEAVQLYLRHLRPDGVLAVNVSNRHADLPRVVRHHAAAQGLAWAFVSARSTSPVGAYRSDWMLLSRDPAVLLDPAIADGTRTPPRMDRPPVAWSDDHAPVWAILR